MKICIFIEDFQGGVDVKSIRSDLTPGDEHHMANRIATILEDKLNELQSNLKKAPIKRAQAWGSADKGKKSCLH